MQCSVVSPTQCRSGGQAPLHCGHVALPHGGRQMHGLVAPGMNLHSSSGGGHCPPQIPFSSSPHNRGVGVGVIVGIGLGVGVGVGRCGHFPSLQGPVILHWCSLHC